MRRIGQLAWSSGRGRLICLLALLATAGCGAVDTPVEPTDSPEAVLAATWQFLLLERTELLTEGRGNDGPEETGFRAMPLSAATAFAIDHDLLVTNAHVIESILDVLPFTGFPVLVAIQHRTGEIVHIREVWVHPDFDEALRLDRVPDVALLRTETLMPSILPLADVDTLYELAPGGDVTVCGFPGGVTEENTFTGFADSFLPRATCLVGEITQLNPFADMTRSDVNNQSLRYDVPTRAGSSGSSVVNPAGEVIGLHSFAVSGADESGGARSDVIGELWGMVDRGAATGVEIHLPRFRVMCDPAFAAAPPAECQAGAACVRCDQDGDGWSDLAEIEHGGDPCAATVTPLSTDAIAADCRIVLPTEIP